MNMKEFTLCYKTNTVAPICGYDTVEEAKAAIEKLTANASKTNSIFDSVEFFIEDSEMNVIFRSDRFVTSTVEDINDINNL